MEKRITFDSVVMSKRTKLRKGQLVSTLGGIHMCTIV